MSNSPRFRGLYKQLDRPGSISTPPLLSPRRKWLSSMCELLLLARYLVY